MRYYYYGNENGHRQRQEIHALHVSDVQSAGAKKSDRDLVIEDDTIYEIDRECLRCRRNAH